MLLYCKNISLTILILLLLSACGSSSTNIVPYENIEEIAKELCEEEGGGIFDVNFNLSCVWLDIYAIWSIYEEETTEVLIERFEKPPEREVVYIETVTQNNCGGTSFVLNEIERSRMIKHEIQVHGEASVSQNGSVSIPGIGQVNIGGEIAGQYGEAYGEEQTLSRSITLSAKEGTNMQHTIEHVELSDTGKFTVKTQNKIFNDEYKFRSNFALELKESVNIGCD